MLRQTLFRFPTSVANLELLALASTEEDVEIPSAENDDRGVAEAQDELWVSPMFVSEVPLPDESQTFSTAVPCIFIAAPIRDEADLYGVLGARIRVVDIGDNLLRPATYSDLFATSDTYVVSSDGVLLSPSHYEQELKAAGRLRTRSMLELKLQTPKRDELTSLLSGSFFGHRWTLTSHSEASAERTALSRHDRHLSG